MWGPPSPLTPVAGGAVGAVSPSRMLARGRRLLGYWKPLFSGRLLLVTNTVSCGAMLGTGDMLQQAWHHRQHPGTEPQPARTGDSAELGEEGGHEPGRGQRDPSFNSCSLSRRVGIGVRLPGAT